MARTFCKTWWGNAWLQALSHIDYSNRIPRGARYARNGSVKSVVFDGNKIKAKVQGSRVRPYTVTMVINKFSESEKERLIDGILAKPAIVPQLLNMNLSPAVLDIAKEARLKVFPSSWRDLTWIAIARIGLCHASILLRLSIWWAWRLTTTLSWCSNSMAWIFWRN